MRAILCLFFALALSPPASSATPYRLVNLTDDYASFFDRTRSMPTAERVTAFKTELSRVFPGFYDVTQNGLNPERYDARVARSFERFPAARADFSQTAAAFSKRLAPAFASFQSRFPDVQPIGDIYLVHSLGLMDGGTRWITDRIVLIFGADVMAEHEFENETPFFHHELFHVYHFQHFKGCAAVWCMAWVEGLAVLAATELNPGASDAELLLNTPEPMRKPVDSNLKEAVCTVTTRLDSATDADRGALFSFERLNEKLPPRFGYYVGYLAAREASKTQSSRELARLSEKDARAVLERSLARIADCSHASTP